MSIEKRQAFVDIIAQAENKLFDSLSELENDGQECRCDDRTVYKYIHEGSHFDEIMAVCINCGGYVENA